MNSITIDNLVYNICTCINNIEDMPKYKIFKIHKLKDELDYLKTKYFSYDIYDLSNSIIHIMQLESSYTKVLDNGIIIRDANNMYLQVASMDNSTIIVYYPKSNRVHVVSKNITYDMYKNTKCANIIKELWEETYSAIKNIYFNCVVRYADTLRNRGDIKCKK